MVSFQIRAGMMLRVELETSCAMIDRRASAEVRCTVANAVSLKSWMTYPLAFSDVNTSTITTTNNCPGPEARVLLGYLESL